VIDGKETCGDDAMIFAANAVMAEYRADGGGQSC